MMRRDRLLGYVFAIGASGGLGAAVAFSRAAYNGGTDALTIATIRTVVGVLLVGILCLASGRSLRLPWKAWRHCLGLGLLMSVAFYGNIGSVKYIPVGLAALLFFVYPPLVAILMATMERRWLGLITCLSLALSFCGLGVMLGVSLGELDWRGVAIALSAGTACALNVVWVARKMRDVDVFVMTFHMTIAACVALTLIAILSGGIVLPDTVTGWWGAGGVIFCQAASIPFFYAAIPRIGAENTSMLNNLQPVASIILAWVLFAEALSPVQALGGAMVISGILLMQWYGIRQSRR